MTRIESRCVDCGLPCLRYGCSYYRCTVLYCDRCGEECQKLHVNDWGDELCEFCFESEKEDEEEEQEEEND